MRASFSWNTSVDGGTAVRLDGLPQYPLTRLHLSRAEANALYHLTWEACEEAFSAETVYLVEFPEDLGRTPRGTPASLWRMPPTKDLAEKTDALSFAINQCDADLLGADADCPAGDVTKPTRFLSTCREFEELLNCQWPKFDENDIVYWRL